MTIVNLPFWVPQYPPPTFPLAKGHYFFSVLVQGLMLQMRSMNIMTVMWPSSSPHADVGPILSFSLSAGLHWIRVSRLGYWHCMLSNPVHEGGCYLQCTCLKNILVILWQWHCANYHWVVSDASASLTVCSNVPPSHRLPAPMQKWQRLWWENSTQ